MALSQKLIAYYRQARKHQMETYGKDGLYIDGVDQRQFTGGGACYGEHALAAYWSARSSIHFIETSNARGLRPCRTSRR